MRIFSFSKGKVSIRRGGFRVGGRIGSFADSFLFYIIGIYIIKVKGQQVIKRQAAGGRWSVESVGSWSVGKQKQFFLSPVAPSFLKKKILGSREQRKGGT